MTVNKVEGYFDICEYNTKANYGYNYSMFLKAWVYDVVTNWKAFESIVFWFEREELSKVSFNKDRKIYKTYSRGDWLNPISDLDHRSDTNTEIMQRYYIKEYLEHEPIFMRYIRFAPATIPISDNSFLLPVYIDPTPVK